MIKKGTIDVSNLTTPPAKHELATAKFFSEMGKDVMFIEPSNIPEVYRPDILMDGVEWEMKSPIGSSKRTIEKNYHKAALQSKNIIFDLRRINVPEAICLKQLEREFYDKKSLRLLVIKKDDTLVKFGKID